MHFETLYYKTRKVIRFTKRIDKNNIILIDKACISYALIAHFVRTTMGPGNVNV